MTAAATTATREFIVYPEADMAEMQEELFDARQWVLDVADKYGTDTVAYAQAVEMRDITRTVLRHMQLGEAIPFELT